MDWDAWARRAVATLTMTSGSTDVAWKDLFAPNGTYQDVMTKETADLGSVYDITRSAFPDWCMTVIHAAGDDGGGVIEWESAGHLPHGPSVVLHGCSVIDLSSDGKVTRWRDYFDMGEFTRQAGTPTS
jgi:limonene-1,2-epoxide hydrolase